LAKRATTRANTKKADEARKLAIEAARIAEDNKAENIVVLDLRGVSPITDYFVICTGSSDRQMRAVAENIMDHGKSVGQKVWQTAGLGAGDWVVLDFVDVVVHVFDEVHRKYYDLELIWGEVPRVRWRRRRTSAKTENKKPPAGE
jgi:ribosome-associated protein